MYVYFTKVKCQNVLNFMNLLSLSLFKDKPKKIAVIDMMTLCALFTIEIG